MRNFVQSGNTIPLTAPYAVNSGDGVLVGSIFGVAANDAAISETVETAVTGVYDIAKNTPEAWTQGAPIYWDDTNKQATTVSTSNTLIGVATEAAGSNDTTGRVRLNGSFS